MCVEPRERALSHTLRLLFLLLFLSVDLFSLPFLSQDEERPSVDVGAGLSRELQAVQKASCESSREELTDLDLERLRDAAERGIGSPPEETHLGRLQEKHQQELLEEEIAKVLLKHMQVLYITCSCVKFICCFSFLRNSAGNLILIHQNEH